MVKFATLYTRIEINGAQFPDNAELYFIDLSINGWVGPYRKQYFIQSGYAAVSIFIITFILYNNPVVIASIGATAFIVFSMPNSITAQPRRIIGGHLVGFFVGSCFGVFPFMNVLFFTALWYALSVGITLFIMVVMDFEHPPAAGTALGMTLVGYTSSSAVAIIISIVILAFISYAAKPFLRDLV